MDLLTELAILVLAAFVGFEVISKVPNTLHTPLMSGTNAIHGIVVIGGLYLIGQDYVDGLPQPLPAGDRDHLRHDQRRRRLPGHRPDARHVQGQEAGSQGMSRADVINLLYIVAFSMFITGLRMLRGPRTAVRGNQIAALGMAIAVVATLLQPGVGDWLLMIIAVAIGTAIGVPAARSVKMTAMPQMVALFNGVGGGAVALIAVVEFRSGHAEELEALIPLLFGAIIGSISFWGSNIAFLKLQELMKGGHPHAQGRQPGAAADLGRAGRGDRRRVGLRAAVLADPGLRGRAGRAGGRADRRRRHAGRHLAP